MLQSSTSTTTRRPTPPGAATERARPAPVVDLTAWRAARRAPEPEVLRITPELLAALGDTWRGRSR